MATTSTSARPRSPASTATAGGSSPTTARTASKTSARASASDSRSTPIPAAFSPASSIPSAGASNQGQGAPGGDLPDVTEPKNWIRLAQRFQVPHHPRSAARVSAPRRHHGERRRLHQRRLLAQRRDPSLATHRSRTRTLPLSRRSQSVDRRRPQLATAWRPPSYPAKASSKKRLRQGQVRHALKVALACCLATAITYFFHLRSEQLAPVFAFLLFTLGMPSPRMNWLLTQIAVTIGAIGSAIILVYFHKALLLYLALTLLWIFTCLLFSGWLPLPPPWPRMISAIGVFTFLEGNVGAALDFFVDYKAQFPRRRHVRRRGPHVHLAAQHAKSLRPASGPSVRPSRTGMPRGQRLAPHGPDAAAARAVRRMGPVPSVAPIAGPRAVPRPRHHEPLRRPDHRLPSAESAPLVLQPRFRPRARPMPLTSETRTPTGRPPRRLRRPTRSTRHAAHSIINKSPPVDRELARSDCDRSPTPPTRGADPLVAHNVHASILRLLGEDLQTATKFHNTLFANFGRGFNNELVNLWPGPNPAGLFDGQSVRTGVKLVLILALLMLEEGWLGLPGGTQVAFFATFFASTANLGRQNKTDVVDVVGLLSRFHLRRHRRVHHQPPAAFPAALGARVPRPVPRRPRVSALADVQRRRFAGGPGDSVHVPGHDRPRMGFVHHGAHPPRRPVGRRLHGRGRARLRLAGVADAPAPRTSIAAALRATAESLAELFDASRTTGSAPRRPCAKPSCAPATCLDDARYLPGPEHADLTYHGVLAALQEIDASLEYIQLLISLEADSP